MTIRVAVAIGVPVGAVVLIGGILILIAGALLYYYRNRKLS